jgi:alpha-tubulin suppressor-like RCC1 family protein
MSRPYSTPVRSLRRIEIWLTLSLCVFRLTFATATAQSGLQGWGYNFYGQLCDGTTVNRQTSVPVQGITDVIATACGGYHTLFLKSDGTVWSAGGNEHGQLGDGTNTDRSTPVQVRGLTDVVAISAARWHSLAVKADGTVWAWGYNLRGQLGNFSVFDSNLPVQVQSSDGSGHLSGCVAVAAGGYHSVALKSDGTVVAWGDNSNGQLGDGTGVERHRPVNVPGLTAVAAIAGGDYYSLALKSDGTVWAWGANSQGQLGDGTNITRNRAVPVSGLKDVAAIAGGVHHSLAITSDGSLWVWGDNSDGELGDGTYTQRTAPIQPSGMTGVVGIASGFDLSVVLKHDGTVWCMGRNDYYQLGTGAGVLNSAVPVQASGLTGIQAVSCGWYHGIARRAAAAVSGTITLSGCVNSAQPITFTFRPTDGSDTISLTVTLAADGSFQLPGLPRKSYSVRIKGSRWLAKTVSIDASNGDVTGLTATLLPGDVNNDNTVNIADLGLLADAFNTTSSSGHWNANADLNCDGMVNIADLGLLADNFGKSGDP